MPNQHAGDCLQHSRVADSRYRSGRDTYVYRKRECLKCGRVWPTNEIPVEELKRLRRAYAMQQQLHEIALAITDRFPVTNA